MSIIIIVLGYNYVDKYHPIINYAKQKQLLIQNEINETTIKKLSQLDFLENGQYGAYKQYRREIKRVYVRYHRDTDNPMFDGEVNLITVHILELFSFIDFSKDDLFVLSLSRQKNIHKCNSSEIKILYLWEWSYFMFDKNINTLTDNELKTLFQEWREQKKCY
jgi:hypothetical protein